jgi:exodeoxyribonuclease VII large subunit
LSIWARISGSGSLEELWAFNDEQVAWAIYASQVLIVTGVGHETDFTVTDFVAVGSNATIAAQEIGAQQNPARGVL